jgi:D-alanine-D-alanine ligase
MRKTVAVIFGGKSSEHSISCISAAGVLGAIDRSKYDVIAIGITKLGQWHLVSDDPSAWAMQNQTLPEVTPDKSLGRVSVDLSVQPATLSSSTAKVSASLEGIATIFPVLHGEYSEDGKIQGMLEMLGIPYVGCNVLASAIAMDKHIFKVLISNYSIPNSPYALITKHDSLDESALAQKTKHLKYPLFVKPANAGSSIGVSKVSKPKKLKEAIKKALRIDNKVLLEQGIVGREIECGILERITEEGTEYIASLAGEIVPRDKNSFYDFETKYTSTSKAELKAPTKLTKEELALVQETSIKVFKIIGGSGLSRIDFFLTDDKNAINGNRLIVNEANTIPGFTPISMYPSLFEASGIGYTELITSLIESAR